MERTGGRVKKNAADGGVAKRVVRRVCCLRRLSQLACEGALSRNRGHCRGLWKPAGTRGATTGRPLSASLPTSRLSLSIARTSCSPSAPSAFSAATAGGLVGRRIRRNPASRFPPRAQRQPLVPSEPPSTAQPAAALVALVARSALLAASPEPSHLMPAR
ncbi:hypothetical protein BS50DRAFT_290683 [Corynespora cassiicola Philippines]|uniref:Uncharacterized protein n=1 Tax=Corynespora cassiicola Philippines TaxID=1448308 RepID=A0A2T2NVV0_CORCC|nr:hypothetical protein BS50DRAFT_290683 [Corynespora cassiicola Philippines]